MRSTSHQGLRRLRSNPWFVDGAIALLLLVLMVLSIGSSTPMHGQPANDVFAYVLAVGMAAPFATHRRAPAISLAVVLGCLLVYTAIGYAAFPGVNAFVLLFAISLHSDRRLSIIAFAATASVLLAGGFLQPTGVVDRASAIMTALATIVAWLGGENLRQRRARWIAMAERAELLEREREERAQQAVLAERLRIARELHDVVAHALSVIAVQSGVGHHVAATRPAEAQAALATIETTSRSALVEMRRMLGILRHDDLAAASTAPAPGVRDVPDLIRQVAAAGLEVGLHITGSPSELPASINLSAYRIIQEALTNAIKHGGPTADVTLAYTPADVSVEVSNDASLTQDRGQHVVTPGHGIIGMRERVGILGGDFTAATRPGGGFRVSARLPFECEPA